MTPPNDRHDFLFLPNCSGWKSIHHKYFITLAFECEKYGIDVRLTKVVEQEKSRSVWAMVLKYLSHWNLDLDHKNHKLHQQLIELCFRFLFSVRFGIKLRWWYETDSTKYNIYKFFFSYSECVRVSISIKSIAVVIASHFAIDGSLKTHTQNESTLLCILFAIEEKWLAGISQLLMIWRKKC